MKKKECFECHGKSRKKVRQYAIYSTATLKKDIPLKLKEARLIYLCDSCAFKLLYAQTKVVEK